MKDQVKYQLVQVVKHTLHGSSRERPVPAKKFCSDIYNKKQIKLQTSAIRDLINFIRSAGIIPGICANGKGYYLAKNVEEIKEYQSRLYIRIVQIQNVLEQLTRDREKF